MNSTLGSNETLSGCVLNFAAFGLSFEHDGAHFGNLAFSAVIEFVWECVGCIPGVTLTAVDFPGQDIEACRQLAEDLGAEFRVREYQKPGISDFGLRIPG